MRHILQFKMFDSISYQLARNITDKRKSVGLIIIITKCSNIIIFGTKYELFLPPYQLTFLLVFGQATDHLSHFNELS